MNVPIFPLKNCLFPEGLLSLMIFEIRYLKMIKKVNDEKSRFGVVLLKQGSEIGKPGVTEQFYNVGTLARIMQIEILQPTLFSIRIQGEERFKIQSANKGKYSLWSGMISKMSDDDIIQIPEDMIRLSRKLREFLHLNKNDEILEREMINFEKRFQDAGWVANRWAEILPIDSLQRQKLLEEIDPIVRLKKISIILQQLEGI